MAYTVDNLLDSLEESMMKTEDALTNHFSAIRTGKASPALVENITFEYYGTQVRIKDAANISAPEPRLLAIQPWDVNAVKGIEKALLSSNIGITPMNDGRVLKLPIPELSQERRATLSKQAKSGAEEAKVALRNIRRDGNDAVKKFEKDGELTEDDRKDMLDKIQKLTDSYIAKVDAMLAAKDKELMTI